MEEFDVPESHPRYDSLLTRHRIEAGVEKGITSTAGLVAQGRGEAFDYLLSEETIPSADAAERAAAAHLLLAEHPVISVNGNVAAMTPEGVGDLAAATGADIEVNLFGRTEERMRAIVDHLAAHGVTGVKGHPADAPKPRLEHQPATQDPDQKNDADVVLVPLEDGDRAEALGEMGKTEIVVDLNPLSRSAEAAAVPVIDNLIRAIPNITEHAGDLADADRAELQGIVDAFDPEEARREAEAAIRSGELS
ncbi:MAG: phosphopantothenate/pantothenate synthetase [Haloarculaceae archaeon]